MAAKHQLLRSIHSIVKHNRDGAYATQHDRKTILMRAATTLVEHGFKLKHVQGLKQKHIRFLNHYWLDQGLSAGTCKNRNSALRWLCEKLGKLHMMPTNEALGVPRRTYASPTNKAIALTQSQWRNITDPHVKISLQLQRHLGLRREESLKIKPFQADKGDHIALQASWCKGGRKRTVPIISTEARYWLDEAKKLVKHKQNSLIPSHRTYIQQRYVYDTQLKRAGIQRAHGLRHAYAQARYQALTGWPCPIQGGPNHKQLTTEQKATDQWARRIISEELGHSRIAITTTYCGQ